MYSGYITASEDTPSKSGLFFTDLSGCTVSLLEDLEKEDHDDTDDCFAYLYKKAQINLKIDVQKKLASRFHIDKKLITRETSEFKDDVNDASALAGIKIKVTLPKYARLQILSIGLLSENDYTSPEAEFFIYKDDADGELLSTVTSEVTAGRNTVEVFQEFEHDTLFIAYDPTALELRKTRSLYYADTAYVSSDDLACTFPCSYGGKGSIHHINGGGLNIKFVLYCSMEKVILENLPLFQYALLYRIGVDTMKERITTQNTNKTSVLTQERATELMTVHNEDYQSALDSATMNLKMTEDPVCFACKQTISTKTVLP